MLQDKALNETIDIPVTTNEMATNEPIENTNIDNINSPQVANIININSKLPDEENNINNLSLDEDPDLLMVKMFKDDLKNRMEKDGVWHEKIASIYQLSEGPTTNLDDTINQWEQLYYPKFNYIMKTFKRKITDNNGKEKTETYEKKVIDEKSFNNLCEALRVLYTIKFNEFTRRIECDGEELEDYILIDSRNKIESNFVFAKETSTQRLQEAFIFVGRKNSYHPIKDYLESIVWDGKSRIRTLFRDVFSSEQNYYSESVAYLMLVGSVARIYQPGIKFDTMCILQGERGLRKSTFIQKLYNGYYATSQSNLESKDSVTKLIGLWGLEFEELRAVKKSDINTLKSFITTSEDRIRKSYAINETNHKRTCILWGTTNECDYIKNGDEALKRRLLTIRCISQANLDNIDFDQIWAEAYQLYKQGEPIFIDERVDTKFAKLKLEVDENFVDIDERAYEIHVFIQNHFKDKKFGILELIRALNNRQSFKTDQEYNNKSLYFQDTKADQMAVARMLKAVGYRKTKDSNGNMKWKKMEPTES